jgi:hypothetical protein
MPQGRRTVTRPIPFLTDYAEMSLCERCRSSYGKNNTTLDAGKEVLVPLLAYFEAGISVIKKDQANPIMTKPVNAFFLKDDKPSPALDYNQ